MNELKENITSQFSDRNETNRSLKNFEKNIKTFVEKTSMSNSPRKEEEDSAILSKRPLGGWSCASCEKDLSHMNGNSKGFQAWSKLPVRNADARMQKTG